MRAIHFISLEHGRTTISSNGASIKIHTISFTELHDIYDFLESRKIIEFNSGKPGVVTFTLLVARASGIPM